MAGRHRREREPRRTVAVYRVREPRNLDRKWPAWRRFDLAYPQGKAHDAEALLVRPGSGRVFVVTKHDDADVAAIYRAPRELVTDQVNPLRRVEPAPATVTAGDFAPDGERFVLCTYREAFVYDDLGAEPEVIELPEQRQGESLTFTPDGAALLVGSEGENSTVWKVPLH